MVLRRGYNLCLYGEIWEIIPKLSLLLLLIWSTDNSTSSDSLTNIKIEFLPFFDSNKHTMYMHIIKTCLSLFLPEVET